MTEEDRRAGNGRETVVLILGFATLLLAPDQATRIALLLVVPVLALLVIGSPRPRFFGARPGPDLQLALGLLVLVLVVQGIFVLATGARVVRSSFRPDASAIALVVVGAFAEEFFFRGFVQASLARRLRPGPHRAGGLADPAVLLSALIFAAAHAARLSPGAAALRFFPGLIFAWSFRRSGGLAAPFLLHLAFNLLDLFLRIR